MNFDKKSILAFLLIGLVFLLVQTPLYKKYFFPQVYQQEQTRKAVQDSLRLTPGTPAQQPNEPIVTSITAPIAATLSADTIKEKTITVETAFYRATFTNRGALLTSWTLKKYTTGHGAAVQMIANPLKGNLALSFISHDGDSIYTALYPFSCSADSFIDARSESKTLRFELPFTPTQKVIKEIEFLPNAYHIQVKIGLQNMEEIIADKAYNLSLPSGLNITEKRVSEDMSYAKTIVAAAGEYSKNSKANGQMIKETGSIDWIALRTKYFLMALIPQQSKGMYVQSQGWEIPTPLDIKARWKKFTISLTMPYTKKDYQEAFTLYLGPLDDDILKSYQVGLENAMDFGWKFIQPISVAILWTFKQIHKYVTNYGLVLIIFSLLLKIITTPLTNKSTASMKKMQTLQPLMNELKEKYGNDPQRLNKETMKLYKEQGINPMSGCFPVLIQIPIFIALFNVFRSTIELRQQGFISWISDLSSPDTIGVVGGIPINVLPILMGVTMILQQKMTVTDPKQKAMVYLMPALMIFMFYSFPSGLNLYYTIFNILTIIQQKYLQPS
ncbi:membrane protein insertase YidC [bacterium]|nr:membrane protein insertase YidC [bacterium]